MINNNLSEIWEMHQGIITKAVNHFKGYNIDYEDLKQEAFFPFYKAVKVYDDKQIYAFSTILYNMVYWYFLRYFKKNIYIKNEKTVLNEKSDKNSDLENIDFLKDESINIEETCISGILNKDIEKAFEKAAETLLGSVKDIAFIYFIQGMSFEEIAKQKKISVTEVRQNINAALKAFRKNNKFINALTSEDEAAATLHRTSLAYFRQAGMSCEEWYIIQKSE